MQSLTLASPSKLNLTLKITGRRPDGYHNLLTLFHRISLADTIRLQKIPSGFFLKCSDPRLPIDGKNLITQAYRLLQARFPKLGGVRVFLKKRIPMGAGLGGGSSNAAHFLLGMKKLYGLNISKRELKVLGGRLGADVPFFLEGTNQAIGREKGDVLQARPAKGRLYFLLILSNKGLMTKLVYQKLPKIRRPASLTKLTHDIRILCAFLAQQKVEKAGHFSENDLELSAFQLRPSLRRVLEILKKREIPFARMTGSGATVFGVLSDSRKAKRRLKELQKDLPSNKILLCHTF